MPKDELKQKIGRLPEMPGVYLMKDVAGRVIYAGKAADLKKRVTSYFQPARDEGRLISRRIKEVCDIDFVVVNNEKEAFILENNFIKQLRPRYNVLFRDDKSFVCIKIPADEPFPRPVIARRINSRERSGARYFGPYSNARAARRTLDMLNEIFPLRKCTLQQFKMSERPCLYGQMGRCLAPCCKKVSKKKYDALLEELKLFLEGRRETLLSFMREQMQEAADRLDFERAALLRDRLQAVEETLKKQLVASEADTVDRDVVGCFLTDLYIWIAVLFIRKGALQDVSTYRFSVSLDMPPDILRSFLGQFYSTERFIPDEVLLPVDCEETDLLAEWLSEKKGRRVGVLRPQRGKKKKLTNLACRNAREAQKTNTGDNQRKKNELESLKKILSLSELPLHIECFDISNLSGREAAGSMVVFKNASAVKDAYRRYRIRSIKGQNDIAMLHQIIFRRYRSIASAGRSAADRGGFPDLVLVDGGPAQLQAARNALDILNAPQVPIAAIAKARTRSGSRLKGERVFVSGKAEPIELTGHSHALMLVTRIRDEAHRFAIQYHRKLRHKASFESPLVSIPGVGDRMARRIMDHFKSLQRVKEAKSEELCSIKGISKKRAAAITDYIEKHWR